MANRIKVKSSARAISPRSIRVKTSVSSNGITRTSTKIIRVK